MYYEMEAAMKCFCSSYKLKCTQIITKTTIPKKNFALCSYFADKAVRNIKLHELWTGLVANTTIMISVFVLSLMLTDKNFWTH